MNKVKNSLKVEDLVEYESKQSQAQKVIIRSKKPCCQKLCNSINKHTSVGKIWNKIIRINVRDHRSFAIPSLIKSGISLNFNALKLNMEKVSLNVI